MGDWGSHKSGIWEIGVHNMWEVGGADLCVTQPSLVVCIVRVEVVMRVVGLVILVTWSVWSVMSWHDNTGLDCVMCLSLHDLWVRHPSTTIFTSVTTTVSNVAKCYRVRLVLPSNGSNRNTTTIAHSTAIIFSMLFVLFSQSHGYFLFSHLHLSI